jgi:hypothetical protein
MKNLGLLFVAAFSLFLYSCTSDADEDVKAPEMIMQQPVDGAVLRVGDEFHMEMHLSDNVELKSCVVEISPAQSAKSESHGDEPWQYTRTFDFSGMQNSTIHEHMIVPDTIGHAPITLGMYKFTSTCTDKAGNQTQEVVNFEIAQHR